MIGISSLAERAAARARLVAAPWGVGLHEASHTERHLAAAVDWLCRAQDATPDDGVAQTYFIRKQRWAASYPETTGYIIPTLYRYADVVGDDQFQERARRMAHWESDIQCPDGGVVAGALGDSSVPTVFNTGQVLFGWVRAAELEDDARFYESAARAADWLCRAQDDDGCWRRFGSPMTNEAVNSYNTRTAWALCRAHELLGEQRYLDAAIANCDWAMTQQHTNGWLASNCLLDERQPFVHTIAYAMRGFLEVGSYGNRAEFIDAAARIGDALAARLPRSGFLPGRFDARWQPTVRWSCLTGNAQIAINWGRLYQITGDSRYRDALVRINGFTRRTQRLEGEPHEAGAIKGSFPVSGGYHPWQYPNWAAKFFADALMMEIEVSDPDRALLAPFPG